MTSVYELINQAAARSPLSIAISAPGREPLTYGDLLAQVSLTVTALNDAGIGRHDRVATVLPDGPAAAVAFLAIASGAAVMPLSPACGSAELTATLRDPRVKAVVLAAGGQSLAATTAESLGIEIIRLVESDARPAGSFILETVSGRRASSGGFAQVDDTALVLHTSGTTGRPKTVALTHRNICSSARSVAAVLQLTPSDRCLSVMPLFHVHGLIGSVLASIAAGSQVICSPGFEAGGFFQYLRDLRPTWFTAVPTMHQAILARAPQHADVLAAHQLRFIRSASASLTPRVAMGLESVFRVPVVEAYGMTEAAHQIASNSPVMNLRRLGSVGPSAGADIVVVDKQGQPVPVGTVGEVVVRGPGVICEYDDDAEATVSGFAGGWLQTADLGYLNTDGYLYLTGRSKDVIKRGGETISPAEIERVLLEHPAVTQAAVFGVPDDRLGEQVAAAVMLTSPTAANKRELQAFMAARLSPAKVPRVLQIVDSIPLSATGKVKRSELPRLLGLDTTRALDLGSDTDGRPWSPLEQAIAELWARVLRLDSAYISRQDDFFRLGGDSVVASRVVSKIRELTGIALPLHSIYYTSSLADFAQAVIEAGSTAAAASVNDSEDR